jgi:amphi-Trp domain-containing protein
MAKLSEVKMRNEVSAEEAAEQLSHLALGLATGEIWIDDEARRYTLHPGSMIKVEMKGSEDREDGKLVIQLSWKHKLRIGGTEIV